MKFSFKKLFTTLLLMMGSLSLFAQGTQSGFNVKIKLADKSSGEPVAFATISVSRENSAEVLKYTQTDDKGAATITGLKGGKYVIKGILLGYKDYKETINVTADMNLGTKTMDVQMNYLQGATISDVGNPIVVKKDTIEHNVSLMQTSDSDVLEDILKRLPGVEVSSDGKVTANGKEISKVYIDGKSFFLDDPQLATKNLPAKIVNKVKVVNKKSEQAEFTGIDDGEEETVLDLNIKPGMMNGWMGNATGGAGMDLRGKDADGNPIKNDVRFQGGGMAANFTDKSQIVILGNVNNTNNRGFSDITGDAMRGMRGMRGGDAGIATAYMLGANGTWNFGQKSEINGNYLFNGSERVVEENTDKITFKEDGSSLHYVEDSQNNNNTYGHRVGARLDWKISKKTSIIFTPNFNFGWGNFDEKTAYTTDKTFGEKTSAVNAGVSKSFGNSDNKSANGRLMFRQKIGEKKGRTVSVMLRYELSRSTIDGNNMSDTKVFDETELPTEETIIDERYDQLSKSANLRTRVTYTEPLGKNFFLEASYRFRYSYSNSNKQTYEKDEDGKYSIHNLLYSSDVQNINTEHSAGLSLKKQEKKYSATLGAQYMPNTTRSYTTIGETEITPFERTAYNWSPNARLELNFNDNNNLRFDYRGRTTQPTVKQIQPVPDHSNPLDISLGNPDLTPSFTHNVDADYRFTDMKTFASLNAHCEFNYSTNNIVNASYIANDGVQYRVPLNNDKGAISSRLFVMFNTPIAKSKFSIMSFTMGSYNKGVNFVGKDLIDPTDPSSYTNPDNYTENSYNSAGVNENLRFIFRDNIFDISIGDRIHYSQTWYSITEKNVAAAISNAIEIRALANIPKILNVSTDCAYTMYTGYTDNTPMFVWNAEISKLLFKNKATLALKMYDILNQSRNVSRTATDNYVLNTYNNTLGRYFMVTFAWRFGKFGENRDQMREAMRPRGGFGGPPPRR